MPAQVAVGEMAHFLQLGEDNSRRLRDQGRHDAEPAFSGTRPAHVGETAVALPALALDRDMIALQCEVKARRRPAVGLLRTAGPSPRSRAALPCGQARARQGRFPGRIRPPRRSAAVAGGRRRRYPGCADLPWSSCQAASTGSRGRPCCDDRLAECPADQTRCGMLDANDVSSRVMVEAALRARIVISRPAANGRRPPHQPIIPDMGRSGVGRVGNRQRLDHRRQNSDPPENATGIAAVTPEDLGLSAVAAGSR